MNKEAFRSWLINDYRTHTGKSLAPGTIDSRIANCARVDEYEGNLDQHFEKDRMQGLLARLNYMRSDLQNHRIPKHQVPLSGDVYNITATLKSAVLLYKRFLEEKAKGSKPSRVAALDLSSQKLSEFFRRASFYRYHEKFEDNERLYKIRLAKEFSASRSLLDSHPKQALEQFRRALKSKDNNIINWRNHTPLLHWLKRRPDTLINSLRTLWNETIGLQTRFTAFCESLQRNNINDSGSQLAITSTLLMALSPLAYPPIKTKPFLNAMRLAGWSPFSRKQTPFEKYQYAHTFMDALVKVSPEYGIELRDLLDAQAVVWCVSGGWPRVPVPAHWMNDPEHRAQNQRLIYAEEFNELEAEPQSRNLTSTEKLTLVLARRGQGTFREQLVKLWSCCSVTECSDLTFLRASHIRPWKCSDNQQRLDPYNGLLLSPNLDVAFEAGLITFEDDGRIRIADRLEASDRKLLGIHSKLRLRQTHEKHRPYLTYHRTEKFKNAG